VVNSKNKMQEYLKILKNVSWKEVTR
jgi:flavin-binding protein dodecin